MKGKKRSVEEVKVKKVAKPSVSSAEHNVIFLTKKIKHWLRRLDSNKTTSKITYKEVCALKRKITMPEFSSLFTGSDIADINEALVSLRADHLYRVKEKKIARLNKKHDNVLVSFSDEVINAVAS